MKIKNLRLESFRNYQDATLDLDFPFVVIRGGNAQGKSSIAQAISMALTPSTTGLDPTGRGYIRKIRRGETKAVLTIDVQGGTHIVRNTVTLNTNTSGRTSKAVCLDDEDWVPKPFENKLDANVTELSVALNTDYFIAMKEDKQKSLLAKLALPARYDFQRNIVESVEKLLGAGEVDFNGSPFDVIKSAYDALYDLRKEVNKQVKDFVIPEPLPLVAGVNSESLQQKLAEAQAERQRLSNEREESIHKSGEVAVKRAKIQSKIENLETRLREDQESLRVLQEKVPSETKMKEAAKLAALMTKMEALQGERENLQATIKTKTEDMARYQSVDIGSQCPTCEQVIDGARVLELSNKAATELRAAQRREEEVLQEMKAIGDVAGAVKLLSDYEEQVKQKNALNSLIADRTKALKAASAELKSIPQESVDINDTSALGEIDKKISALTDSLRPVIAAEERAKEIKLKKELLARLQAKAGQVDTLVKYFDKDGIKAKLLAEYIGPFESKSNEVMNAFGYKCDLFIEPYELLCTDTRGIQTPVIELSGSEQLMFSAALQCAVSRAAGLGLVVVDRMDTFVQSQRKKANGCLYKLVQEGMLEQVILIVSDESTDAPALPNAVFYRVNEGTVERIGPGGR